MATETELEARVMNVEEFVEDQASVNEALLAGQKAILKHWEAQHEANRAILTSLKTVSTQLKIVDERLQRLEKRA